MIPRLVPLLVALALAACTPVDTLRDVAARADSRLDESLPAMRSFGDSRPARPSRPNSQIARDFLDLSFRLESGRALPVLTRFEGPITVRVDGAPPPTLVPDLERLLVRLRREAGIDISRVDAGEANVTISAIPRAELQRLVPQAACFVSPRISTWEEFKATRGTSAADWTTLRARERMAIFLPNDVAPQEIRDCLHEELAQAIGPLNDLYRLPDSVFNDDNFHTVLTGFDMLILRLTYAPDLASGMSEAEVAARLPALLGRYNPGGGITRLAPFVETPRNWIGAVEAALGPRTVATRRREAAVAAVAIAESQGWRDGRRAFSLYILGRLSVGIDPDLALASFLQAEAMYRARPETRIQAAHVAMQLAAYALTTGNPDAVIAIADGNIPMATEGENAALLSQFMMMKAEALDLAGRVDEARVVRRDALGWARYGFGGDAEVRARAQEIASLSPARREARLQ